MKYLFILLFLACALTLKAQPSGYKVQKYEFEASFGITCPLQPYVGATADVSGQFGLEIRRNFDATPWDAGVRLFLTTAGRNYSEKYYHDHEHYVWRNSRSYGVQLTGDYNLKQGAKCNPFAGVALGICGHDVVGDFAWNPSSGTTVAFTPRIGVELLRHIRITAEFNISGKSYNNFAISLGGVIGGGAKKRAIEWETSGQTVNNQP